jgi:hypothetical protein
VTYPRTAIGLSLLSLSLGALWLSSSESSDAEATSPPVAERHVRDEALVRARVLRPDPFKGAAFDFNADPNAGVIDRHLTSCTFLPSEPSGTTPKFDCRLESGEKIKVKYGGTREIPAEIAATRLLQALGFPADRMSPVETVNCFGCVLSPFHLRWAAAALRLEHAFDRHLDYHHATTFSNVAVERKFPGDPIETSANKGWGFYELSRIDPARGGATTAEVDALRLIAVFLAHWDNKPANQRLICEDHHNPCGKPMAMLHDLGSDFGPYKVDLDGWRNMPIWTDSTSCTVSMSRLPFDGGTFGNVGISEAGRRLLANRLKQFTHTQIEALFRAAGFADLDSWVAAFEEKVRQIDTRRCAKNGDASS